MPESSWEDPFNRAMRKARAVAAEANQREMVSVGQMCPLCIESISPEQRDDPDAIYREVAAWVTGPKLQSPVLRRQTGRIAHKTCIHKVIDGEAPDQEPIPGLES